MMLDDSIPAMDHLMGEARRNFFDRLEFVERFCVAHRWNSDRLTVDQSIEIFRNAEFQRLMRKRAEVFQPQ